MKAPIPWLKEYVEIKLPLNDLMWKMTEIGLTTESYQTIEGEKVLEVEVTPNRPDWLSILGIAREIAIIEKLKVKLPKLSDIPEPSSKLPLKININSKLVGRYTGITIANVKVKAAPLWMQKRLILMGLRPINNLVDITNYCMYELGIPIHVFDYDKFKSSNLKLELSKGGEKFISVDEISYPLPPDTLIIKDGDRVIDLCGIKGGLNTGISNSTKNIYIHVPIYSPTVIRKTSLALKLASDASYIYERGPDRGGNLNTLKRVVALVLEFAGGKVASEIIDLKDKEYSPAKISVSLNKLESVLGFKLEWDEIIDILSDLNLSPQKMGEGLSLTIPTYRGDLKIEEDIVEEVARIHGYNNFPKTLPTGTIAKEKIAYYFNPKFQNHLKTLMYGVGFSEIQTLSLTSREQLIKSQLNLENHIKIANPVSLEYEYFRSSLVPNLLDSIKLNSLLKKLKLFELNKVYFGPPDKHRELYKLAAIQSAGSFREFKGVIDLILEKLNIDNFDIKDSLVEKSIWHPTKSAVIEAGDTPIGTFGEIHPKVLQNFQIKNRLWAFEAEVLSLEYLSYDPIFEQPNKYPPQIEDVTLEIKKGIKIRDVISSIKISSKLVSSVELVDIYNENYTFRIYYQAPEKTLDNVEVEKIRTNILKILMKKFGITIHQ
ncbi:phenylalanine--tRNA ligase subunit beta [Candidatus Woesebacteria bacterium RIFCSPLOWO2_01_FULL_37_19]|uniref:Phenylalanine--tRNA ligase beta subunit n=2 Tax=Candidatus Woeseibacteriota TaxID=1752722 RepID=A0A1F8BAS8_9BACT|nr:MAG: phenylalanine--tRNA ligase subunit beta [Candidatus Woesebacteria bacterium RIFCSPLOWO2_01_FULL_37_19]